MLDLLHKIMDAADRLADILFRIASLVCLPALAAVITIDVFMRYFLRAPMVWAFEFSEIMLMIILFGSIPFTTKTDGNVRMELIYRKLRGPALRFANVLWGASGLFFSVLLAIRTVQQIPVLYDMNRVKDFLKIPTWPFSVFVLLISILLSVYFLHLMFFGPRKASGLSAEFGGHGQKEH
jgi:TRAP-type C4-dicarboxylate transport system permease small subunit